ncbi:uncharacterized protein HKW66_Vig0129750 [Vigna angularis]|uniref:Uncharacterized protein n=1 Tax=Phaseolus angularis TaxID=3914 RepID=A0A8T0K2C2_PHAAN|nr:uncharacterized protein HKW66_Vig0129750 [Vigna angularis]
MAQLNLRKVLLFFVVLLLSLSICISSSLEPQYQTHEATNKKQKTSQQQSKNKPTKQTPPSWILDEDDDLVSEFTDLPNRFHQTLLPDLEQISTISKAYITTDLDPSVPADLDCQKDFSVVSRRRSVPSLPIF